MSASSEPRIGGTFAGYRIDAEAGRGGMGVVYRATHVRLDRTVALKLIAPALADDPAFAARFEREWRLLAGLEHPNVIGVYEAGEDDGRLYLAMRWVAGGDLARRLRGTAGLEPRVAVELLAQVAAALDAAHARGVVHRDVKPANILLDSDHAWLTDFGAGKDLTGADPRTAPSRWIGTADYVAPELLDGVEPTPAADVYSLGCVLFETLTGRVPFPRDTELATLWAHRYEPPPSTTDERPGLPAALDDVLRRMLAKDPGERPSSAGEALRAARAAVTSPPPGRPTVVGGAAPTGGGSAPAPAAPAAGDAPPAWSGAESPSAPAAPAGGGSPPAPAASSAGDSPPASAADPPPSPASRAQRRLGIAAAAVAVVVVAVVLVLEPGDDPLPKGPAATVEAPPPLHVRRLPLSPNSIAGNIVAGEERGFVADEGINQLVAFDGRGHNLDYRIGTDLKPRDVALSEDGSVLWSTSDSTMLRKDPVDRYTDDTKRVAIKALYLAVRGEDLFVMAGAPGGPLQRVSTGTGGDSAPLEIPGTPADLETVKDGVFALTSEPPRLHRIAPDGSRVEDSTDIDITGVPDEVALVGDDGWLTDSENGYVVRFDLDSGDVRDTFEVEGEPNGITSDGKVVYVAVREGRVERFDAEKAERLTPIDTKGRLGADIDIGPDGVLWVSGGERDVVQIEFD